MSYPPQPPAGNEPPSGEYPPPPPGGGGGYQPPPGGGGYPPPPGGGGGGYPPPPGGGGGYAQPQTSQKALWSLIVGIIALPLALCCSAVGLVGIAAFFLGNSAKKDIAASGGQVSGAGMAKAGVVLGIVASVLAVLTTILAIYLISTGDGFYYDYNFDSNGG